MSAAPLKGKPKEEHHHVVANKTQSNTHDHFEGFSIAKASSLTPFRDCNSSNTNKFNYYQVLYTNKLSNFNSILYGIKD